MVYHATTEGVYGPGSHTDKEFIPVPVDCARIFKYLASVTPGFTKDESVLNAVKFEGNDLPLIPGPIKSQAFTAALFAMAGVIGQEILSLRGKSTGGQLTINTDHAGLYLNSVCMFTVDGQDILTLFKTKAIGKLIEDFDHGALDTHLKYRTTAIYPTKTKGVWYQLHGSTFPPAVLEALDIPLDTPCKDVNEAYEIIKSGITKYEARELEMLFQERGLCGSICYSPKRWNESYMGMSLARWPLMNYTKLPETPELPPAPWSNTADQRPLAGIKVIEMARIIAAPALGCQLAAFGADVVRIQARDMVDLSILQFTSTAGKRTCELDLRKEADRATLHTFIKDADVVINGYRHESLERKGFGLNDMLAMANARGRGLVYLDETCFGPDGYWSEKPGWQQIADAAAGSEYVCGKAYGFEEGTGVLPSLPISDLSTGIVALVTTLMALRDRGRNGGSYHGTAALTAYNMATLLPDVGLYPPEIVKKIQDKFSFAPMTPDLHVEDLFFLILEAWQKSPGLTSGENFWTVFEDNPYCKELKILSPVVQYAAKESSPHWKSSPVPFCHFKELKYGI